MIDARRACLTSVLAVAALCAASLTAAAAAGEKPGKSDLEVERAKAATMRLKAMAEAKKAFVKVIFTPKWDQECALEAQVAQMSSYHRAFWTDHENPTVDRLHQFLQLHRDRRTSEVPGLLIGPGLVVIGDDGTGYEWKLVGKVEIQDAAGKRWAAEPHRLLTRVSALLLKAKGDGVPAGVKFRPDFKLSMTARVFGAALSRRYDQPGEWSVYCGGASLPFDAGPVKPERLKFVTSTTPRTAAWSSGGLALLFDSEARPVGLGLGQAGLTNGNRAAWDPAAILSEGVVGYEKIRKAEAAARKLAEKLHYKVRFEFRVEKEEDQDNMFSTWARRSRFGSEGGSQDAETFGLSVGGGRIFIARMLNPAALRQVDKVSVEVGGQWKKAKFLAAFLDISGMLIEVPGVKLEEPKGLYGTKGVEMMKPFVYCAVRELLGERRALAKCVRYRARRRGYKDRLWPAASHVPAGALLFDLAGGLAGVCIRERRDRELTAIAEQRGGYYYGRGEMKNLVPFSQLKDHFENARKHALPTWRPMSKQESRRLIWLGVEFDPITKELAKRLKLQKPTRGGVVGLTVSSVYPGSPAAKLGLEPQDILLCLQVKGLGDPLPLTSQSALAMGSRWGRGMMRGMGGMRGMVMRTWKPRTNVLTRLLTEAGPGGDAEIAYLCHKDKKIKKGRFKLAYGPVDYDSAEKHKDEKLGLSVKPLTYEVRVALALKGDDLGVVISKVEQGSAAQLARLIPYLLITHIEGQPVKSVDDGKKIVAKLREAKKEKIKLQVSAMGKSRFADLRLEN